MDGGIDQDQLDQLFTVTLETAIALLEKHGEFFPLLFELRRDGDIHSIAVLDPNDRPSVDHVVEGFFGALAPRAASGDIRAVAIGIDRKLPIEGGERSSDSVEIRMRAPNYAANIFAQYEIEISGLVRKKRELTLGGITAEEAANELFPETSA